MSILLTLLLTVPVASAQSPEPCPLTEAQVAKATGETVTKFAAMKSPFGTTQCVFTMQSGTIQLMRVSPEARRVKTDAELAADFAANDARRLQKAFPVPVYSTSGGFYVVLPKGVWQVLSHRGTGWLNPEQVVHVLIAAR